MLEKAFEKVYAKFRTHFYEQVLRGHKDNLSATEEFMLEGIHALGSPTVSEFAKFAHLSLPNATYRVNALVKKGFLQKITPQQDKREVRLCVTDKFYEYFNISAAYSNKVMRDLESRLTPEQAEQLAQTLTMLSDEIMIKEEENG